MNIIEKIMKKYIDQTTEYIEGVIVQRIVDSHEYAMRKVHSDWNAIYKQAVSQFYSYVTTRYYRHVTGKGTGTGVNLYKSNLTEIVSSPSYFNDVPSSSINYKIAADNMDDYWKPRREESGYGNVLPASYVLDVILAGTRGIPGHYGMPYAEFINVRDSIGNTYSGVTLGELFDQFINNEEDIYHYYLFKRFNDVKHLKL